MASHPDSATVVLNDEVRDALGAGRPIVALESTLISHGLPKPTSAATARRIEDEVRSHGAAPATIAVLDGAVRIGLEDDQLVRVAEEPGVVKTSVRDLGPVLAKRCTGATTVAATARLAHLAGVRLFATGGLGGVHRGADRTFDESADLLALATCPITTVCAGVKSILDVPATLERLESMSIPVLGYRTSALAGFYIRDSGESVPWQVDSAAEVAAVMRSRAALGLEQGVVLANPIDPADEMDLGLHDRTLAEGLAAAERDQVQGKDVTPYLLAWFHEHTDGASLLANVSLVLANARLAAEVAVQLACD